MTVVPRKVFGAFAAAIRRKGAGRSLRSECGEGKGDHVNDNDEMREMIRGAEAPVAWSVTDKLLSDETLGLVSVKTSVTLRSQDEHVYANVGRFRDVKVKVTRYGPSAEALALGIGTASHYEAQAWVLPADGRRAPHWRDLPSEVARRLVGRGLA